MPLNLTISGDPGPRALHLISADRSSAAASEESASTQAGEPTELADVRRQLEDALEELAFLREQLRGAEAWNMHRFETLKARHRAAHQTFVRDLALLVEGLDRPVSMEDVEDRVWSPAGAAVRSDAERVAGER
jgi:hypothetical protein